MGQPVITIYTTGWCPYCQRAKGLLEKKKLAFSEINVEDGEGLRAEMVARSQRRSVPQIFIGEKHIGGCDDLFALDSGGELDRLTLGA